MVDRGDYDDDHPAQVHLLVEVSSSSLRYDRGTKATLYAQCGVPQYWIVNVVDKTIEVYETPVAGRYTSLFTRRRGETVAIRAFGLELDVDAIVR